MGQSGGWHEGGEYVGLGIGQAIYQLPNMWLRATGEDAFESISGIRGFLDFLVYRTRPDGTDVTGSGSVFERLILKRFFLRKNMEHRTKKGLIEDNTHNIIGS